MDYISESIKNINSDIESLRADDSIEDVDFELITRLAGKIPFKSHNISTMKDEYTKKLYLEMLSAIIRIDFGSEDTINRFIFVQWILKKAKIDISLQDLYKESCNIDAETYREFYDIMSAESMDSFIVDSLILANIGGKANQGILEYIADICSIFGMSKEGLRDLSLIAQIILCQNIEKLTRDECDSVISYMHNYKNYVDEDMLKNLIVASRVIEVDLSADSKIKWKKKNMEYVVKGDIIAEYEVVEENTTSSIYRSSWLYDKRDANKTISKNIIRAGKNGIFVHIQYNHRFYGVISNPNDNIDSIREWIKAGGF